MTSTFSETLRSLVPEWQPSSLLSKLQYFSRSSSWETDLSIRWRQIKLGRRKIWKPNDLRGVPLVLAANEPTRYYSQNRVAENADKLVGVHKVRLRQQRTCLGNKYCSDILHNYPDFRRVASRLRGHAYCGFHGLHCHRLECGTPTGVRGLAPSADGGETERLLRVSPHSTPDVWSRYGSLLLQSCRRTVTPGSPLECALLGRRRRELLSTTSGRQVPNIPSHNDFNRYSVYKIQLRYMQW